MGAHQSDRRLCLAAEPQAGGREVSAAKAARKTLAYDFFRFLYSPLKQHANITIDKRPVRQFDTAAEQTVQVLPAFSNILTESEKQALAYAISDKCMEDHGWQTTRAGQVKDMEYDTEIFPRGFITGLRKILGEVEQ
ncbi:MULTISPECIES: gamma-mobile-trio protein GmtX [unclassified Aeromonas]|uniref:gamma-mobile-trio protein GmtX n=1 Tax=unclassified Aeromonas TaxID=257493 RepID=UPI0022E2242A|nr:MULTISPECIES: gamma-mobile-trio protein GmtX [unclassified Aeromonas]